MGKSAILSARIVSSADSSGFRRMQREIKSLQRKVKRQNGAFGSLGKAATNAAKEMAAAAGKATAMTTAVGSLAPAVAALSTAAVGAAAPVAALGVAMAPAAIGAGALAVGTLSAAFKGLGAALDSSDPAAAAEALGKMSPAAQAAVQSLRPIADGFRELGTDIQQHFWANLSNVGDLAVLMAPLRGAMTGLASDMGNATAGMVDFVSHGTGLSATKTLIDFSAQAAGNLWAALMSAGQGMIAVGAAAAPIFADLTAKISEMAARWAESMTAMYQSGQLQDYFASAVQIVGQLGQVFSQVGTIISSVWTAAATAGMPVLGLLGQLISATAAWTSSAAGMSMMTDIFTALNGVLMAVAPIFGQIATILLGSLVPAFAQILTAVTPLITVLLSGFQQILAAIQPVIPVIVQLASALAAGLGAAVQAAMPILIQLAQIIGQALTQALYMVQPLIPVLVSSFQQLMAGVQPIVPLIAQLFDAFLQLLGPVVQLASAVIPGLVQILIALMPAIMGVIQGVISFVQNLTPLISLAAQLAGPVLGALAGILGVVAGALQPVIAFITQLALEIATSTGVTNVLKGALHGLQVAFGVVKSAIGAAQSAFSAVQGAIRSVASAVSNLIGKLGSIRWPSPPAWLGRMFGEAWIPEIATPIGGATGPMQAAASDTWGLLGSRSPRVATGTTNNVTITVNGALDPRAVADQIRGVLQHDARTRGMLTPSGGLQWHF